MCWPGRSPSGFGCVVNTAEILVWSQKDCFVTSRVRVFSESQLVTAATEDLAKCFFDISEWNRLPVKIKKFWEMFSSDSHKRKCFGNQLLKSFKEWYENCNMSIYFTVWSHLPVLVTIVTQCLQPLQVWWQVQPCSVIWLSGPRWAASSHFVTRCCPEGVDILFLTFPCIFNPRWLVLNWA